MKKIIIYFIAVLLSINVSAQKRNYIWCFGDSAGIDFNLSNPSTFQSGNDTRGSNCAIADTAGNLLFYATTSYKSLWLQGYAKVGAIFNKNHQLMQNGDTIIGSLIFNEVIIIPIPENDSLYYVFFAGVVGPNPLYGLYTCTVNINANGGLGEVTSKNNMLQPFALVDCLNAIKHGNGRDWWLFFRRWYPGPLSPNNEFYSYLLTPLGITNYSVQNVGTLMTTGGGKITFAKQGDKLIYSNWRGLIEKYDFNRCTGTISNPITINPENTVNFDTLWSSNEISPDGNILYVSTSDYTSYLFQYDLTAPNISITRQTIWSTSNPVNTGGILKRGPDDKIYFACAYVSPTAGNYPYADSMYNAFNMNLGVINQPDSLGAACDFQPYSFYLGGKRTYWGLPNNPDYDMPRDSGSVCDTIQWTGSPPAPEGGEGSKLFVTYITSWQKLFVNAQGIKGKNAVVKIYDLNGRVVFKSSSGSGSGGYFTEDVDVRGLSSGMYVVSLITDKEVLVKKFIKQ